MRKPVHYSSAIAAHRSSTIDELQDRLAGNCFSPMSNLLWFVSALGSESCGQD
jgi:hypothetical protein